MHKDPTPLPDDWRLITWENGTAELQKSAMAAETYDALRAGETNVEEMPEDPKKAQALGEALEREVDGNRK